MLHAHILTIYPSILALLTLPSTSTSTLPLRDQHQPREPCVCNVHHKCNIGACCFLTDHSPTQQTDTPFALRYHRRRRRQTSEAAEDQLHLSMHLLTTSQSLLSHEGTSCGSRVGISTHKTLPRGHLVWLPSEYSKRPQRSRVGTTFAAPAWASRRSKRSHEGTLETALAWAFSMVSLVIISPTDLQQLQRRSARRLRHDKYDCKAADGILDGGKRLERMIGQDSLSDQMSCRSSSVWVGPNTGQSAWRMHSVFAESTFQLLLLRSLSLSC